MKNLEMFLGSCLLNLENILAVTRKTNLEIFLATSRIATARYFGWLFFLAIARTLTISITITISRSENAFITVQLFVYAE